MKGLALWGVGFVGTVVWPLSPEGTGALAVTKGGWNPFVVGPLLALGQACAHLVLYLGGEQLRRRWRWFDQKCQRAVVRYGDRLTRGLVRLGVASGLIGLPPSSVTAALAPGLRLQGRVLLPLLFAMRIVRLTAVAYLASVGRSLLPHWHW